MYLALLPVNRSDVGVENNGVTEQTSQNLHLESELVQSNARALLLSLASVERPSLRPSSVAQKRHQLAL